jgi:tetratricopeptide (TPR) repeat protein
LAEELIRGIRISSRCQPPVKVDPGTAGWWISLAYALRRTESIEKAEAILLRAQAIHPEVAMIAFNLACYASVTGRMEEAKARLRPAVELDRNVRRLAVDDDDLRPLWDWIGDWSSFAAMFASTALTHIRPLCAGD